MHRSMPVIIAQGQPRRRVVEIFSPTDGNTRMIFEWVESLVNMRTAAKESEQLLNTFRDRGSQTL
jgi:hypothetical protein